MARDRYLWNAGEETINKPGAEIKADTPKSKWQNFWYYHKFHVAFAIIGAFIVGTFIYDIASKVTPDYQIAIVTGDTSQQAIAEQLGKDLAPYGKDLNGDGQVVVQINVYALSSGEETDTSSATAQAQMNASVDMYTQMASVTKYSADMQTGESLIYIMDDENFLSQTENGMFAYVEDGSTPEEGATDYQNMRIAWSDCAALAEIQQKWIDEGFCSEEYAEEYLEPLGISLRVLEGTSLEGKEEKEQYFQDSKEFLDRIIHNEPVPVEESGSSEK